jgi:hypothetical protein
MGDVNLSVPSQHDNTPYKCSEKGCPFFAVPASDLCSHHGRIFADDEYIEFDLEVRRLTDRLVPNSRRLNTEGNGIASADPRGGGLQIVFRGDYARRVWAAAGQCNRCGANRTSGRMFCSQCLAYDRFRKCKKTVRGLCRNCSNAAEPGKKRCRICLNKVLRYALNRNRFKKATGLCVQCGLPNDRKGKRICTRCESKESLRRGGRADEALRLRLCRQCHGEIEPQTLLRFCARCRQAYCKRMKQVRAARHNARLCKGCGRKPPAAARMLCVMCLAKNREYGMVRSTRRHAGHIKTVPAARGGG